RRGWLWTASSPTRPAAGSYPERSSCLRSGSGSCGTRASRAERCRAPMLGASAAVGRHVHPGVTVGYPGAGLIVPVGVVRGREADELTLAGRGRRQEVIHFRLAASALEAGRAEPAWPGRVERRELGEPEAFRGPHGRAPVE